MNPAHRRAHRQRTPLPWHGPELALSCCGRPYRAHVRDDDWGGLCLVCQDIQPVSWHTDPAGALRMWLSDGNKNRRDQLVCELRALATLAQENPGRFVDLVDAEQALSALSAW